MLFTDRALYRPGQPILYKGICLRTDAGKDDYRVLAGQKVTVVLADPNGREVSRATHQANDYGSFFGQFIAPASGVTGQLRLYIESGPRGDGWVQVEEYKRPKFRVELEAPKAAPKLGEAVVLVGRAESYAGTAIDGATVRYRVVREVQWPVWRRGFGWPIPRPGQSQAIAHGELQSGVDGTFEIRFPAQPDASVPAEDEPVFRFVVNAEVTDSAGETRWSERVVRVGYTALQVSLTAAEWQTVGEPVALQVRAESLDGEPQSAEGVIRIHRLKLPSAVRRPASLVMAWYGGSPEPGESPEGPDSWELGDVVVEQGFTTTTNGQTAIRAQLPVGAYRAVVSTQDRFGAVATAQLGVQVLDPEARRFRIPLPHHVAAPRWSVEPGGTFVAIWGTGYDRGRAFVEIEHRGRMIQRYWTGSEDTQVRIEQAVTEAMRGGFTLYLTRVQENRAYLDRRQVVVPWSQKDLEVSWERVRSKLEPGQRETWTAVIKKRAGTELDSGWEPAVAEVVATLYDASLDAFLPHHWPRELGGFRLEGPARAPQFENVWRSLMPLHENWSRKMLDGDIRYRDWPVELRGGPSHRLGDLGQVSARRNLQETAFFFPQLVSDATAWCA
jgi:hypothetical protein